MNNTHLYRDIITIIENKANNLKEQEVYGRILRGEEMILLLYSQK